MSKLRVVVDIDIDDERCAEQDVTEDTLVNSICVIPDDAIDGVLVYQNIPGLDITSDIMLGCGKILSTEFIPDDDIEKDNIILFQIWHLKNKLFIQNE